MSDFLNNLGKIGMVLQAGGGSLAGRDGMAVVRDWEKQQEDARKREAISGLLAQSGIGGIQRGLLEQLPVDQQAPAILNMLAQMEAQRRAAASAGAAKAKAAAEQEAMLRAYEAFAGGGQPAPTPAGNPYSLGMDRGDVMPPSQPLSFGRTMPPAAIEQSVLPPAAGDSWQFPQTFPNADPRANSVVAQSPALASRPVPPVVSPQEVPPRNLSFGEVAPRPPRSQMTPFEIAQADMQNLMSPRALALRGVDPTSPSFKAWEMAFKDAERRAELTKPPEPQDPFTLVGKINADLAAGRISPADAEMELERAKPRGMSVEMTPDGRFRFTEGPGVSGSVENLTERQSVIALFGAMMDQTMPVINQLEQQFDPSNLADNAAARAGWTGNYIRSVDAQKYSAASNAWAEAVLRIQTGAAATQPEIDRVVQTYFAEPGDDPETIQYKRLLRTQYANAVAAASGGRFAPPGQEAVPPVVAETQDAPASAKFAEMSLDQLLDSLPTTEAEATEWNRRYEALGGQ